MFSERNFTSSPFASSLARPRASRCFRTTADGRIPLAANWPALFDAVRTFGSIALQTRHTFARLVTTQPLPSLTWHPCGLRAAAEDGTLHFRLAQWHRAWGRLELCDCCGSPGRIEVHNLHEREFLQFCAPPGRSAGDWAALLAALANSPRATDLPTASPADFPPLRADTVPLDADTSAVLTLLATLRGAGTAVAWTLRTPEVCHIREFVPVEIDATGPILTARDRCSTVQFTLGGLHALAVDPQAETWPLHLIGPNATVLLTLSGAADPVDNAVWRNLLRSVFRELR